MTSSTRKLPPYVEEYLNAVPVHRPNASVDEERKAYVALCNSIASEPDTRLRNIMTERLELHCKTFAASNPVLLSYIYRDRWEGENAEDRELLARPLEVYLMLEEIVSEHSDCRGYTKRGGRTSRYPLSVPQADGTARKVSFTKLISWNPRDFMGSYYAFGVHKLYIGKAISQMLQCLEERYGLDFSELEKNRSRNVSS